MTEKTPINLRLLLSLSCETSSEERAGIMYECRKLKRKEESASYEIRKKRAAIALILAKTQRIAYSD